MKQKIRGLCAVALAFWATQGVMAANVSADAKTEKGRVRLVERDILTFVEDGTLTVTEETAVELLMVGGGGGGGANRTDANSGYQGGAGGGAGGVIHKQALTLLPGTYSVAIGVGGGVSENGGDTMLSDSSDFVLTAFGGGAGADWGGKKGKSGGSGGGSTLSSASGATRQEAGAASHGDEDNLGSAGGVACHQYGAGGGGGAGAAGETPTGSTPGKGGDGYACAISGTNVWYAGGGAGYRNKSQINGGLGGGGSCVKAADGLSSTPGAGEDGLGGGGCGGAKGGNGIMIVSFVPEGGEDSADFNLQGGDSTFPFLNDTVLVFTNGGTLTVTGAGHAEVLVVGGGGGGGALGQYGAGGGGAGGVIHRQGVFLNEGTYDIVVGAGGEIGADGAETTAFGFRALGGGAGSDADITSSGRVGGSGGGATCAKNAENLYPFVSGADAIGASYGNMGHAGGGSANPFGAGGGGGAGTAGDPKTADIASSSPGRGGDGYTCSITGRETCYGGGGAGFRNKHQAEGGLGGGGSCVKAADDQSSVPGAGTDGLGGGGCGGAKGGSGIVIVRYHKISYTEVFEVFEGATGGTLKRSHGYCIHTFAADGEFTMPCVGKVEVLLVGGGGGGGGNNTSDATYGYQGGGGGGAGGIVHTNVVLTAGTYSIAIGAGGAAGKSAVGPSNTKQGENGGDSSAFDLVARGGGGGAKAGGAEGNAGGSGGGATSDNDGTGFAGGDCQCEEGAFGNVGGSASHKYYASGGGGAGGVGSSGSATEKTLGAGGPGVAFSISGSEAFYGGGGSGFRSDLAAAGGTGGGGSCLGNGTGTAGVDGLGGGGCGGYAGGSGIVIVRYRIPSKGMSIIVR